MPIPVEPEAPAPVALLDGRNRFPSTDDRLAYETHGPNLPFLSQAGKTVVIYSNEAGSVLADIVNDEGAAIAGSSLTVDNNSQIPQFYGPVGAEVLYARLNGGTPYPIYAWLTDRYNEYDAQFEALIDADTALDTRVDTLEAYDLALDGRLDTAESTLVTHTTDIDALESALTDPLSPILSVKDYGAIGDGATDDTSAIQDAINAAVGGGSVYFPLGTYRITSTLVVSSPNTNLIGVGGDSSHDVGVSLGGAATILLWDGAADGVMVSFASPTGVSDQTCSGGGVKGIAFDAGTPAAATGLSIASWRDGLFVDLMFLEFSVQGILLTATTGGGEARDSQRNKFENIRFRQVLNAGCFVTLDGTATANASFNIFESCQGTFVGSAAAGAYNLKNCDNNVFIRCGAYMAAVGGSGFVCHAGATESVSARANLLINFSTNGAIKCNGTEEAAYPSTNNTFYCLDADNSTPAPTLGTTATAQWSFTNGLHVREIFQVLAAAENLNDARTALNSLGGSLRLINGSDDHVKLSTPNLSKMWSIAVQGASGNLRIVPLAGSGYIHLAANTHISGPSPWCDVKAYGAVGNGVTDDTAAIQAAITAANTNGDIVFFPAGDYLYTSTLSPSDGVTLQGVGVPRPGTGTKATTLVYSGATYAVELQNRWGVQIKELQVLCSNASASGVRLRDDTNYCVIENVQIRGNGTGGSTAGLLLDGEVSSNSHHRISSVRVTNFANAIWVSGYANGNLFSQFQVGECAIGIKLSKFGTDTMAGSDNLFERGELGGSISGMGIYMRDSCHRNVFVKLVEDGVAGAALDHNGGNDNVFIGVSFSGGAITVGSPTQFLGCNGTPSDLYYNKFTKFRSGDVRLTGSLQVMTDQAGDQAMYIGNAGDFTSGTTRLYPLLSANETAWQVANGASYASFLRIGSGNKLGFFGANPIVRPSGTPADATDLATAIALVNNLKAKLLALGLIA